MIDQPLMNNIPEGEPESLKQYEENRALKAKVAELEQENHTAKAWLATCLFRGIIDQDCLKFAKNLLAIRDLEQQKQGIQTLINTWYDNPMTEYYNIPVLNAVRLIGELNKQATQLKGDDQ